MKIFLALLLMVLALPVQAQTGITALETMTAREKDKVAVIFTQQQRNFGEACTTVKLLKAEALSVTEPLKIGPDRKAVSGRWTVRYSVDACGTIGMRMVVFGVVPGGISIDPLVPGATLADEKLQVDVVKSFSMAGQVMMPQCRDEAVVRDTKVTAYPKAPNDRWLEMWIGRMCGRDIGQAVEFMPTQGGTTFKMSLPQQTAK